MGKSQFPVEKFLSHCTKIFYWRTLWCFRKILLSKTFMHMREASRFCRNCLSHRTETKISVKKPVCFPGNFWYRKNLWIRVGISRFSVKIFMSHSAENFREGILLFYRKFLVSKRFLDEMGGITFFRRKLLVSQCRKNSWASLQYFRKLEVSKNLLHNMEYQVFPSKNSGLTVPKNFVGIPSMFQKLWGIENFYA